jgi:hypothetical protein
MGELDLVTVCFTYNPTVAGAQSAIKTVFVTWIPLALAGIVLERTGGVHARMRGAALLRVLARMAIAVQVAAVTLPLVLVAMVLEEVWWDGWMSFPEAFVVATGLSVLLPIIAVSTAAIHAWHRVLQGLTSYPDDGRVLV